MNLFNLTASIACGAILLLFSFNLTFQIPEGELYAYTVDKLMVLEGLNSEHEVIACYPDLLAIRSNIHEISILKQIVLGATRNPAPEISAQETRQLDTYRQQLHHLQRGVGAELSRLLDCYVAE